MSFEDITRALLIHRHEPVIGTCKSANHEKNRRNAGYYGGLEKIFSAPFFKNF